jgi:hypothetical protein
METHSPSKMQLLTAEDLLAGQRAVHEILVPETILTPGTTSNGQVEARSIRLRPLSITTLTLISRAAQNDPSLVPLLTIKEALVEPVLTLDQVRQLHIGLVYFLVTQINLISGLSADGETIADALNAPLGRAHLLLAKHFGWTPEQVSQLTPGQVAVYLAGIEKLLQLEKQEVG